MLATSIEKINRLRKVINTLLCGSFSRVAPFVEYFMVLMQQNYIEPGSNVLKDQVILDIKQCYSNIDYMTV